MKTLLCCFLFSVSVCGLIAEPIEMTRQQASDLLVALTRIESGINADNVVTAADDMNALRPFVDALDRGKVRAQREMDTLPPSDDRAAKQWAIRDKIESKGDEKITVGLTRFEISTDEIKSAKIPPRDLAPIRLLLRTKK